MLGGDVPPAPLQRAETPPDVIHVLPADVVTPAKAARRASDSAASTPAWGEGAGAPAATTGAAVGAGVVTTAAVEVVAAGDAGSGGAPVGTGGVSGAGVAGPGPAPPGASAVIFAALFAAFAALLLAFVNAPAGFRSVQLVSLVERPG
jgi:hypothetical protein